MSTGIPKTLEVIASVQDLSVRLIAAVKSSSIMGLFAALPAVLADIDTVAHDATLVLPELSGLDSTEVIQLGTAAYGLVAAVVGALQA